MGTRVKQAGLIVLGAILGILVSLNFSAVAQKDPPGPLPVEDLRAFTEVFGRIKADYVEPVDDKKLISEAINGMLSGLDPHSAYLDAEAFKELQVGHQANSAASASKSAWKTVSSRWSRRSRTRRPSAPASRAAT